MKKLKCHDCDEQFQAETSDEILEQLYKHYMENHKEVITGADEAEKKRWMEQFHKDWDAAPEM